MEQFIELVAAALLGVIGNEIIRPFMRARDTAVLLSKEVDINHTSIAMLREERRGWIGARNAFGDVIHTHLPMSRTFLDAAGSSVGLLPPLSQGVC